MRALSLIIIGIMLVGSIAWLISQTTKRPQSPAAPEAKAPADPSPADTSTTSDVVPVWDEWPTPQVALMISGEQHGYFEPCGCTSNQMGGMARRADLRSRLTEAGWDVCGVDLGGLPRRTVRQAQIKFETSLMALQQLKYVAMGLGPEDLRLQPDFLLSQDFPDAGEDALRLISANIVFFDSPELGTPIPSRTVELGGRRIGITSVLSESAKSDVIAEGTNSGITWSDPEPALQKVLQDFEEQQVDFRILLSHATPDESRQFARDFPQFDVIVLAKGFGDPDPTAEPETVDSTLLIQAGHKGKYVGVLGVYPRDDETPVRFQLIPLERSEFADAQEMIELMRDYQQRLLDEQIVLQDGVIGHPSGSSFVGVSKCGECHEATVEHWNSTPHAHALESLDPSHEREGFERLNGVLRIHDPECLSCHVTGWNPQEYIRYRSGFLNKEFATTEEEALLEVTLAGNQCENCHGPGSRHVELIEEGEMDLAREEMRITLEQGRTVCYQCHDSDNSPEFDFDTYWPEIEHNDLE